MTLPQIQVEVHWDTTEFYSFAKRAMNPKQPFVFSSGDDTGYGFYAAFLNGWETQVLKRAIDECTCGMYGDMRCCADAGIFTVDTTSQCRITSHVKERGKFHLLSPGARGLDPLLPSSFDSARHARPFAGQRVRFGIWFSTTSRCFSRPYDRCYRLDRAGHSKTTELAQDGAPT